MENCRRGLIILAAFLVLPGRKNDQYLLTRRIFLGSTSLNFHVFHLKTTNPVAEASPIITEDTYQYTDYYICGLGYQPHKLHGAIHGSEPNWLIWNEPLWHTMSLFGFEKLPLGSCRGSPARPTFDFNSEAVIT